MNCPLCDTHLSKKLDEEYFDCLKCHALVKDNRLYVSASYEKQVYETHNNDVNDERYQNFTSPITNYVLKKYNPAHKGLDFGSGTGPVISKVLNDHGYNSINLYDPFFHPNEKALLEKYDYIFSCEVVEHFHQPKEEYQRLFRMLKPGGRLLIMTHLYDGKTPFINWYYRNDPTHVFIHRKETFVFIASNFEMQMEFQGERLVVLRKQNQ